MNHTLGPWKLDKNCEGFRTVSNGSLTICTIGEADLFPEIEHDAHLIAAAPELLEELKRTLMNARSPEATDWNIVVDRLTNTIAKAERG